MSPRISRRGLLSFAVGAVTVAGAGGPLLTGWRTPASSGTLLPSKAPLPQRFQRPLAVPPVLAPVRTDGTTDYYEVTQRVSDAELLPGLPTQTWPSPAKPSMSSSASLRISCSIGDTLAADSSGSSSFRYRRWCTCTAATPRPSLTGTRSI